MEKKKIISYSGTVDANTGESIYSYEKEITFPETVRFSKHFTKIGDRARVKLKPKDLWKFIILSDYLEYGTNRLVYRHVGRAPIAIKQENMADILKVTVRTVNTLIKNLIGELAVFRFSSEYFINPTFASRSQSISTEHLLDMIKLDPHITTEIDEKQQYIIRKFLKTEIKINK
tara:strand:- start:162 stop:683 length:522 start_codon:yes stop_codon:yes gene_type:complete